eukprot:scaffold76896_cov53-Cyclotella_meneghiniana.AAC.2
MSAGQKFKFKWGCSPLMKLYNQGMPVVKKISRLHDCGLPVVRSTRRMTVHARSRLIFHAWRLAYDCRLSSLTFVA